MSFLVTILGVLAGAWINNVFTWKIKDKIDAWRSMYDDVHKFNHLFLAFCKVENLTLIEQNHAKKNDVFANLGKELQAIMDNIYWYTFIIDECQGGEMYKLTSDYYNNVATFVCEKDFESLKSMPNPEYTKQFNDLHRIILSRRRKTTSFHYMLEQLGMHHNVLKFFKSTFTAIKLYKKILRKSY